MLYSAEMRLRVTRSPGPDGVNGYHLLSFFLHLIEGVHPGLAEWLHRDSAVKPFTLSPLLPPPGRRQLAMLSIGDNLSFRITLLDEKVFAALADSVWRLSPEAELILGDMRVQCRGLATTPAESPWAGYTTFSQFLKNAGTDTRLRLEFLSPATFRSSPKGERNILFPEPPLVFGSLLNRWNAFAGASHKLNLSDVSTGAVRVSGYRLGTRLLDFGSYRELGFIGQATYECNNSLPVEAIRTLNALADFAFYAGTGAKTTMGMGQTRRMDNARSLPAGTRHDTPQKR